jgi:hypothetical protein
MAYIRFHSWMLNGHPGNVTWRIKRVIVRGINHGLYVTSTTDGRHTTGSYHYSGRAVDMAANTRERMVRFQLDELKRFRRWHRHREIIGPDNRAVVLRGVETDLAEGSGLEQMHDNHCHIAQ